MFCAQFTFFESLIVALLGISVCRADYRVCRSSELCTLVSECDAINYNLTTLSPRDRGLYLNKYTLCGDDRVCCARKVTETDQFDSSICGENPLGDRIFGKVDARIDDYPWMVLLEIENRRLPKPSCAGSLINNRYVLTAAQCVHQRKVKHVHLGKYSTSEIVNCRRGDCVHPTVTLGADEVIIHENYTANAAGPITNDIALIRLSAFVYYTDFIKPICLNFTTSDDEARWIAGWGRGANVKQKLSVVTYDPDHCQDIFAERDAPYQIDETQFCVADDNTGGNARIGYSGGPVMAVSNNKFILEGIISKGFPFCESNMYPDYPIISTKVSSFTNWIKNNIKP